MAGKEASPEAVSKPLCSLLKHRAVSHPVVKKERRHSGLWAGVEGTRASERTVGAGWACSHHITRVGWGKG